LSEIWESNIGMDANIQNVIIGCSKKYIMPHKI
jgi:hypothetical protein